MRLISYAALSDKGIPYSKIQIWRLERDGQFPKRVKIGAQRYGWVEAEVERWIIERIRARDEAEAAA